ncbi:hypothetical protein [Aliikangiella maris]|uniref:Uncharacterized protein n=2 Tax=Aliikangiella maris TaxID=3162458 RepID=A0ABV2C078_9GAMM
MDATKLAADANKVQLRLATASKVAGVVGNVINVAQIALEIEKHERGKITGTELVINLTKIGVPMAIGLVSLEGSVLATTTTTGYELIYKVYDNAMTLGDKVEAIKHMNRMNRMDDPVEIQDYMDAHGLDYN